MSPPTPEVSAPHTFVTTRWTEVLKARGESPGAKLALGQLCEAYWMPVFRFIRGSNYSDDSARDLTQEFFARLLGHHGLDQVEQGKGRFRSYLLGAVKHFLADQSDYANAAKRGGGQHAVPLEINTDTHATTSLPLAAAPLPDAFFDRQWALNVIDRALKALAVELTVTGKDQYFETLKPWLVGEDSSISQLKAGRKLGLSEGAIKVAIHRLRKRFRELVKEEIAGTVDQTVTAQEELRYLLEALAQN
jgi:DNA-directed RNA polymerase specialized sigma24 family protein